MARFCKHGHDTLIAGRMKSGWCIACRDEYKQTTRTAFQSIKNVPCMDCGGEFPPECMDFDHVRGEKKFNIGMNQDRGLTVEMLEEIAKCDVVCANCHRIRTKNRRT